MFHTKFSKTLRISEYSCHKISYEWFT